MLGYSGISVAMGNSPDEIKKMCTFVTKTNEESGVAHAIYSLMKFVFHWLTVSAKKAWASKLLWQV